jgi:hypothetical protein
MPGCEHTRTEFLMRRDAVDYVRCLQCDAVFEAEDLEQLPADEDSDENLVENDDGNDDGQPRKQAS